MNKDKLKNIISKKAKGDNTLSGQLYQMFFFEKILEKLSKSQYKYNIILKGGLLLSSIIAEKYHTVIARGLLNTRMKDFYDIYILISKNKNIINIDNLKMAIKNTFVHRKTEIDVLEIQEIITDISKDAKMKNLWKNYQKNAIYAQNIKFEVLFEPLNYITSIL